MFKKVLVDDDGLEITFYVEDEIARVEFKSDGRLDLSNTDDVVLVVNGSPIEVVSSTAQLANGQLGAWSEYSESSVSIMTRIGEFFDGWEFDP